ncbi:MAG TPA: hypothetical protein VJJ02_03435 [Candidatus Paceibacterota bacterium]
MEKKQYRPFQISCGLREGYDLSNTVHTITDARTVIQNWLERRMREGKKVAVGTLLEGQFVYPWIEGQNVSSRYEPALHYKGMIREDASDEEAEEMLADLARELSEKLNQKRVHVEFCSSYFLFEK